MHFLPWPALFTRQMLSQVVSTSQSSRYSRNFKFFVNRALIQCRHLVEFCFFRCVCYMCDGGEVDVASNHQMELEWECPVFGYCWSLGCLDTAKLVVSNGISGSLTNAIPGILTRTQSRFDVFDVIHEKFNVEDHKRQDLRVGQKELTIPLLRCCYFCFLNSIDSTRSTLCGEA